MTKGIDKTLVHLFLKCGTPARRRMPTRRFSSSNQFKDVDSSLNSKTPISSTSSNSSGVTKGEAPFSQRKIPPKNSTKNKVIIAGGVVFLAACAYVVTVTLPSYASMPAKDSIRRKEELLREHDGGSRGSMWKNLEKKGEKR